MAERYRDQGGSLIQFDPTVFNTTSPHTITLASTLKLAETGGPEMIEGTGLASLAISGGGAVQVFQVASNVTAKLSGLSITRGSAAVPGGGVANQGSLTITNCAIFGNSVSVGISGGGIDNAGNNSTVTLIDSFVAFNQAVDALDAGILNSGTFKMVGSTIEQNSATGNGSGGGIANSNIMTISQSLIEGNSAGTGGGIININK